MKVILADPISWTVSGKQTGHYRAVAKNYVAALSPFVSVVVAGGPAYQSVCDNVLILPQNQSDKYGHLHNKLVALRNCRALFHKAGENVVVLQSVGFTTLLIGILLYASRKNRLFLIHYRPIESYGLLYRVLWCFVKRKIRGVLSSSEEFGRTYDVPHISVPDYFYVGEDKPCKTIDRIYDFVSVGIQHPDKGVLAFAEKVAKSQYTMLIAGTVPCAELKQNLESLAEKHQNIHLDLRYMTEDEYDMAIRSGRYAVMNYTDAYATHSSGVVFDFIYRGVPVVGRDCKALSLILDNRMGLLYRSLDEIDLDVTADDKVYAEFMANIDKYLGKTKSCVESLVHFILEDR